MLPAERDPLRAWQDPQRLSLESARRVLAPGNVGYWTSHHRDHADLGRRASLCSRADRIRRWAADARRHGGGQLGAPPIQEPVRSARHPERRAIDGDRGGDRPGLHPRLGWAPRRHVLHQCLLDVHVESGRNGPALAPGAPSGAALAPGPVKGPVWDREPAVALAAGPIDLATASRSLSSSVK